MKKYINILIITNTLLLLFPFLGFPELWENFYVIILAFIGVTTVIFLRYKSGLVEDIDEETSLQNYVTELQEQFKTQIKKDTPQEKISRISDVTIDNE